MHVASQSYTRWHLITTSLTISNRRRTSFSDSPRYFDVRVEEETLKKVVPHSVATAFARRVLPVPGGPTINTPYKNISTHSPANTQTIPIWSIVVLVGRNVGFLYIYTYIRQKTLFSIYIIFNYFTLLLTCQSLYRFHQKTNHHMCCHSAEGFNHLLSQITV